jgi:hypothetical protein
MLISFIIKRRVRNMNMSKDPVILEIDEPHFTVRLYSNLLRIDLKGSVKNKIEEALENKPLLKETIGNILGIFAPLHVRLSNIDSVDVDNTGRVKMHIVRHRTVVIPLELKSAKRLAEKLNQLIPNAKEEELGRLIKEKQLRKISGDEKEMEGGAIATPTISGSVQPREVIETEEKEEEAEKQIEKEAEED